MRTLAAALLLCNPACAQVAFEVASIKPATPIEFGRTSVRRSVTKENGVRGHLNYQGISLLDLIADAYRLQHRQISGPDWLSSRRFDILATIPAALNNNQIPEMLALLLQDRFHLKTHEEMEKEQVYRLVVAKLVNTNPNLRKADKETGISGRSTKATQQIDARTTLVNFAEYLSEKLSSPVIDQTGLTGAYSIHLEWTPDTVASPGVDAGPSLFTAVREQLGLRLRAGKMSVKLLVVDRVEKDPDAN
ncbi:MAG: TIGR03435 family protein [Acidobacteriota bacterium]|nr:TIGR03435 family protein [Acidobacteriota bacterium]